MLKGVRLMNLKKISCLLLLSASVMLTTEASSGQVKPEPPSLSGVVLDAGRGLPFKNARVWIFDEYSEAYFVVNPDKAGHYAIQLPEGYYFVLIGSSMYIPACKSIWVRPGRPVDFSVRLSLDKQNMDF